MDRCRPVWLQPARGSILHAGRTLPGFLYTGAVPRCAVSQSKVGSGLNMRCRRTSRGETSCPSHTHTSSVRTCISRRPRADDAWCELGRSEFQGRRLLPCRGERYRPTPWPWPLGGTPPTASTPPWLVPHIRRPGRFSSSLSRNQLPWLLFLLLYPPSRFQRGRRALVPTKSELPSVPRVISWWVVVAISRTRSSRAFWEPDLMAVSTALESLQITMAKGVTGIALMCCRAIEIASSSAVKTDTAGSE